MTPGERRLTELVRQIEVLDDEAKEAAKEHRKERERLWTELRTVAYEVRNGQANIFTEPGEPVPADDEQTPPDGILSDEDKAALAEILDAVPGPEGATDDELQAALAGEGDGDAPEPEAEETGDDGPRQLFTEAYIAGYEARIDGVVEDANPYDMGTPERLDWKKGWLQANGEAKEEAEAVEAES